MSGITRKTRDRKTIERWASARGGVPASVRGTRRDGAGIIRIHFPNYDESADELVQISWDAFFQKLDGESLAVLYQEATKDGEVSRFSKIVNA